jgi:hypothetical protein
MTRLGLVILIAGTALAAPAAAATFAVAIGSPVGTSSCGNAGGSGSVPLGRSVVCSPIGGASLLDGNAAATFGYVGGDTTAVVGLGYFGTAFGINTNSIFSDEVTFHSVDPTVTQVLVAANLAFSGTMNATSSANAGVDLFYSLYGPGMIFSASNTGIARNDFAVAQGSVSGGLNSALLRSSFVFVPVDTPITMTMSLGTGAGVGGGGLGASASSRFSNSFEVPIGMDAFVLQEGVTANAGDWLVNNRRVGPTAAIPEPATWAMMILGFGGVGYLVRRRRGDFTATRTPAAPAPRPA